MHHRMTSGLSFKSVEVIEEDDNEGYNTKRTSEFSEENNADMVFSKLVRNLDV